MYKFNIIFERMDFITYTFTIHILIHIYPIAFALFYIIKYVWKNSIREKKYTIWIMAFVQWKRLTMLYNSSSINKSTRHYINDIQNKIIQYSIVVSYHSSIGVPVHVDSTQKLRREWDGKYKRKYRYKYL